MQLTMVRSLALGQVVLRADHEGAATLTVAGTTARLNQGTAISFDDSFTHSARWDTTSPTAERALFIYDVFNPGLTVDERGALAHAFAPTPESTW
jgi:hypothetical protein